MMGGIDFKSPQNPQALRPLGSEWTTNLVMNLHAAGLLIGRGEMKVLLFVCLLIPWKSKSQTI